MIENTDWKEIVLPKETEMTREEIFKKNFPQYVTEKGMYLSPFWDLFDAGFEAATFELNKGIIQVLTKENAELKETVTKMNNVIIGTFSNLTKAKEVIKKFSEKVVNLCAEQEKKDFCKYKHKVSGKKVSVSSIGTTSDAFPCYEVYSCDKCDCFKM